MTKNKRFNFNLTVGEDEHKGLIFDGRQIMKTIDVVHLLNELSNENEQLKQQLDSIYKSYSDYYGMSIRNAEWYAYVFCGDD